MELQGSKRQGALEIWKFRALGGRKLSFKQHTPLKTSTHVSFTTTTFNPWVVLVSCFLIVFMMRGIQASYAIFILPASRDLGLDYLSLALPATSCMLFTGPSLLTVGPLIDKCDPRAIVSIGTCSAGLSIALLSLAQSPLHFHLLYGVVFGSTWMSCGLIATTALISQLSARRSGLAITVLQSAFPLGWFCVVPLTRMLIERCGWRTAWFVLGLALTLIAIIASPLLRGFKIGSSPSEKEGFRKAFTPLTKALRSPFYILTGVAIQFICGFTDIPLSTLWVPISIELGIDEAMASYTLSFMGATAFLGTLAMGTLAERTDRRLPIALSFAIRCMAIGFSLLIKSVIGYYVFLTLLGFSLFGMVPVIAAWLGDVFGKKVVGSLFSFSQFIHFVGSASGIYVLSYMAEMRGTYVPALIICLALALINVFLSLLIKHPRSLH